MDGSMPARRYPWLKHASDAHEDQWLRAAIREDGPAAGWAWWVLLEILQSDGQGDFLRYDSRDFSRKAMVSRPKLIKIFTNLSRKVEEIEKLSFKQVGNFFEFNVFRFKDFQKNLRSNGVDKVYERCTKGVAYKEEQNRTDTDTEPPIPPKGGAVKPKPQKKSEDRPEFQLFWTAYPRKVSKQSALKSWVKISPDESLTQKILKAVEQQKNMDQWTRDGGQFIPHPATWLNQKRWEDEVDVGKNKKRTYAEFQPGKYDHLG